MTKNKKKNGSDADQNLVEETSNKDLEDAQPSDENESLETLSY